MFSSVAIVFLWAAVITDVYADSDAAVQYTSVGGTGSYGRVTNMNPGIFGQECPSDVCVQENRPVNGALAPFHEEVSIVFRGPMTLYNIAIFEPAEGTDYARVSSYNKDSSEAENIMFLNNKGGQESGQWTSCGGSSASFAAADGVAASTHPAVLTGELPDNAEVHIMTGQECIDTNDCGFFRPEGYHGWSGNEHGEKIFIVKVKMPFDDRETARNLPAIWMLHAEVVRTAQYGCNCRGMGTDGLWKGGCGELDIAEVIEADQNKLSSTMYTFKGAGGIDDYADRPIDTPVVFVVIMDASGGGRIKIVKLSEESYDFETLVLSQENINVWRNANADDVDFNIQ